MESAEVRQVAEDLTEALEKEGKPLPQSVAKHFWRLIGHIEAGHRKQENLGKQVSTQAETIAVHARQLFGDRENPDRNPGMILELAAIRKTGAQIRKLLWYAVTVLTGLALKYIWEWALHLQHLPKP
jgi:hypothetical protein